jgi:hypothetical protein
MIPGDLLQKAYRLLPKKVEHLQKINADEQRFHSWFEYSLSGGGFCNVANAQQNGT